MEENKNTEESVNPVAAEARSEPPGVNETPSPEEPGQATTTQQPSTNMEVHHHPNLEHPELFNQIVRTFLAGI